MGKKRLKRKHSDPVKHINAKANKFELRYRNMLFVFILFAISAGFIIAAYIVEPGNPKLSQVFYNVGFSLLGIATINFAFQLYTEKQFYNTVSATIIDSLSADSNVIGKYSDNSIISILKNILDHFLGDELSDKFYANIVHKQIENAAYRSDYTYNVFVEKKSDAAYGEVYYIHQELEYSKHIKNLKTMEDGSVNIKCYFSIYNDPFNLRADPEDIVFFREVLTHKKFGEELWALDDTTKSGQAAIIDKLGFEIEWFDCSDKENFVIETKDIVAAKRQVKDKNMIVLTANIPSQCIKAENDFSTIKAKIKLSYPAKEHDYFHCVFPEPTHNVDFCIDFKETDLKVMDDVYELKFISSNNYSLEKHRRGNKIVLKRTSDNGDNTIFPHSGIVFHW